MSAERRPRNDGPRHGGPARRSARKRENGGEESPNPGQDPAGQDPAGQDPARGLARRTLLATTALALIANGTAEARLVEGGLPWTADAGDPPQPVRPGSWKFFSPEEGALVEAIVDRLIPPDPQFAGGKEAGCAVFIDGQLAGPYGRAEGLYMRPPFVHGTPQQGAQGPSTPAEQYRKGLAAFAAKVQATHGGKTFAELPPGRQDSVLAVIEAGKMPLEGVDGRIFFAMVLYDTKLGFFADPIYGGNRDMVGWRMIGFPGARYDYGDWVLRHNERYPLPPVSIAGRPVWSVKD